jgi:orotidine-5'-phosphate decarboxylase
VYDAWYSDRDPDRWGNGVAAVSVTPIVALDFPNATAALEMVEALGDSCRFYKVGSELFTAEGPVIVARLREQGCEVFLDLKLMTFRTPLPRQSAGLARWEQP